METRWCASTSYRSSSPIDPHATIQEVVDIGHPKRQEELRLLHLGSGVVLSCQDFLQQVLVRRWWRLHTEQSADYRCALQGERSKPPRCSLQQQGCTGLEVLVLRWWRRRHTESVVPLLKGRGGCGPVGVAAAKAVCAAGLACGIKLILVWRCISKKWKHSLCRR